MPETPVSLTGLSPRVRGNLFKQLKQPLEKRSIPARAGEPCSVMPSGASASVYPRACGGTCSRIQDAGPRVGLSPRVRGNPKRTCPERTCPGSIPARAGEPSHYSDSVARRKVYPRACGGTSSCSSLASLTWGLSPRVRGNPHASPVGDRRERSIPARAGEPRRQRRDWSCTEVYPRACGGTTRRHVHPVGIPGLSPRVRGNQFLIVGGTLCPGSIPARAGEP